MKILFFFAMIVTSGSLYSQAIPTLPQVVPPSPNAASLGKFVESPVSLATGIPNIGVPIFNIQEGDISVPINLSYHAGGIKVEEIASYVGLGWALNAGGIISRSIRQNPDDNENGYINTTYTMEHLVSLPHSTAGENDYYQMNQVKEGYRDYEPDIFTFNFGNYTGRFIYDQTTSSFVQTPFSNIKITPIFNGGHIVSFIVTTPDGFKYYFGKNSNGTINAVDYNNNSTSFSYSSNAFSIGDSGSAFTYISSWHLTEIISPLNNKVTFNYQQQLAGQKIYRTQESFVSGGCSVKGYSVSFSETFDQHSVLQSVQFSNGRVDFILDNQNRLDYSGTKALKEIKVYKGQEQMKSFELSYGYFLSDVSTDNWASFGDQNERLHRLKLLSVREKMGENYSPPYIFTYDSTPLPSRFSNGQDYWGYYNGENDNPSLVPELKLGSTSAYGGNAKRSVGSLFAKAATLTKVTYPTGGSAEYFYGNNKVSEAFYQGDYMDLEETQTVTLGFNKSIANQDVFGMGYSKEFSIPVEVVGEVHIETYVTGCDNSGNLANFACDFNFEIRGVTNTSFFIGISSSSFTYTFPPGDYIIKAIDNSYSSESYFNVQLTYQESIENGAGTGNSDKTVGGLRIEKIVLEDGKGGTIEKNFQYTFFGSELSSGFSVSSPIFVDEEYFNGSCAPSQDVYKITSYNQGPMTDINGRALAYSNVTEFQKNVIKSEYTYSKVGDIAHYTTSGYGTLTFLPDLYANWLRGELEEQRDYNFNNDQYELVRSIVYEREGVQRHIIAHSGVNIYPMISDNSLPIYNFGYYSAISEWFRLKKVITTNYFGSNSLLNEETRFYNSNPLLVSNIETLTSDGKKIVKHFLYPFDVTSIYSLGYENLSSPEYTAISKLKTTDQHRIGTVIQSEIEVKNAAGTVLSSSAQRNLYGTTAGLTLPFMSKAIKSSGTMDTYLNYSRYSSNGNPLELKQADGPTIVYIWGYDKLYPVAKIENATYAEVAAALNITVTSLDSYTEANLPLINNLRTNLNFSKAMITTYTYEPLLGITSVTDPKGDKITYHYDGFNRLQYVKDVDGNLLKENKYNYKTN